MSFTLRIVDGGNPALGDAPGAPVADVNVYAFDPSGQQYPIGQTNSAGEFRVAVTYLAGLSNFRLSKVGLQPVTIAAPYEGDLDVVMYGVDVLPDLDVYPDPAAPAPPVEGSAVPWLLGALFVGLVIAASSNPKPKRVARSR